MESGDAEGQDELGEAVAGVEYPCGVRSEGVRVPAGGARFPHLEASNLSTSSAPGKRRPHSSAPHLLFLLAPMASLFRTVFGCCLRGQDAAYQV